MTWMGNPSHIGLFMSYIYSQGPPGLGGHTQDGCSAQGFPGRVPACHPLSVTVIHTTIQHRSLYLEMARTVKCQ